MAYYISILTASHEKSSALDGRYNGRYVMFNSDNYMELCLDNFYLRPHSNEIKEIWNPETAPSAPAGIKTANAEAGKRNKSRKYAKHIFLFSYTIAF